MIQLIHLLYFLPLLIAPSTKSQSYFSHNNKNRQILCSTDESDKLTITDSCENSSDNNCIPDIPLNTAFNTELLGDDAMDMSSCNVVIDDLLERSMRGTDFRCVLGYKSSNYQKLNKS